VIVGGGGKRGLEGGRENLRDEENLNLILS